MSKQVEQNYSDETAVFIQQAPHKFAQEEVKEMLIEKFALYQSNQRKIQRRTEVVMAFSHQKKLHKIAIYSKCENQNCTCTGWKTTDIGNTNPICSDLCLCQHSMDGHIQHLKNKTDLELENLLGMIVDLEMIYSIMNQAEDNEDRTLYSYVTDLLRKCISTFTKPDFESVGKPPFERPSIFKAVIENLIPWKFSYMPMEGMNVMYRIANIYLYHLDNWILLPPSKQQFSNQSDFSIYTLHYTKWFLFCHVSAIFNSLKCYNLTKVFGKTLLQVIFKDTQKYILKEFEQESNQLPVEQKEIFLKHISNFFKALEEEIYNNMSPMWKARLTVPLKSGKVSTVATTCRDDILTNAGKALDLSSNKQLTVLNENTEAEDNIVKICIMDDNFSDSDVTQEAVQWLLGIQSDSNKNVLEVQVNSGQLQMPVEIVSVTPKTTEVLKPRMLPIKKQETLKRIQEQKQIILALAYTQKLHKISIYSKCQAQHCLCKGWTNVNQNVSDPDFGDPCKCEHSMDMHIMHLKSKTEQEIDSLLKMIVDLESMYIVMSHSECNPVISKIYNYLIKLLGKCILTLGTPLIEGPLGYPPFEVPSIHAAVTKFVVFRFSHLPRQDLYKMHGMAKIFLRCMNIWELPLPMKDRYFKEYAENYTRWFVFCHASAMFESLPHYNTTKVFGKTLLRAVFKQIMDHFHDVRHRLSMERSEMFVRHFPVFFDALENEIYSDASPIWDVHFKSPDNTDLSNGNLSKIHRT